MVVGLAYWSYCQAGEYAIMRPSTETCRTINMFGDAEVCVTESKNGLTFLYMWKLYHCTLQNEMVGIHDDLMAKSGPSMAIWPSGWSPVPKLSRSSHGKSLIAIIGLLSRSSWWSRIKHRWGSREILIYIYIYILWWYIILIIQEMKFHEFSLYSWVQIAFLIFSTEFVLYQFCWVGPGRAEVYAS